MAYPPGKSGNPAGRPRGAKEIVRIPVRTQKKLIQLLTKRALEDNDPAAQESLALVIAAQSQEVACA